MLSKIILGGLFASFLLSTQMQAQEWNRCGCERFWVDAEYINWKIKDSPESVPLVMQGPVAPQGSPILNNPNYSTVLGGKDIKSKWRGGGRFALGYWLDDQYSYAVEANCFFLPKKSLSRQQVTSNGLLNAPFLAVPFFDVTTDRESSVQVSFPVAPFPFAGTATLQLNNRMQGAEVNALARLEWDCDYDLTVLAGFRYWNFVERLTFSTSSPSVGVIDDIYITNDHFKVKNNFYGGQVGLAWDYAYNDFFFNVKGKVALGAMSERVDISGNLVTNEFSPETEVFPGGFFAQPSNSGKHKRTQFSVIPEVNANVAYQVTNCLRLQVGYTFLYVSNMVWAGKQINRNINPTQSANIEYTPTPVLVGEALPKASHKTSSLWVQGLNAGVEYQF